MGRMYTASFEGVAVTAIQDLFELVAPADAIVVLHSAFIGQSSDAADAEAEMLQVSISRFTGTSGSGGTSPTVNPHQIGDSAFGGTVEANNTTQGLTTTVVKSETFNVQAGWYYQPTPEERLVLSPSGKLVIELPTAPADSLTMSGSITFEEIGG